MDDVAYEITLVYDDGAEHSFTIANRIWLSCMAEAWAQYLSPRNEIPLKVIVECGDASETFESLRDAQEQTG